VGLADFGIKVENAKYIFQKASLKQITVWDWSYSHKHLDFIDVSYKNGCRANTNKVKTLTVF
jgi:hypothetical protein